MGGSGVQAPAEDAAVVLGAPLAVPVGAMLDAGALDGAAVTTLAGAAVGTADAGASDAPVLDAVLAGALLQPVTTMAARATAIMNR